MMGLSYTRCTASFDAAHLSASQETLFQSVLPVLDNVVLGENASIFAYGQTSAGKTFTMQGTPEQPGIIPRTINHLLRQPHTEITVSFLEIYNERIIDLLDASRASLELRERDRHLVIPGLAALPIRGMAEFDELNSKAMAHRSTGATKLNDQSSRSHLILAVHLTLPLAGGKRSRTSKLYLIDLAGSEDNKRTGNSGDRMVESSAINKSLFVLGQVVEAVNRQAARIPYRDSKITRLLQDALGGTARGMLVACVAPNLENAGDTINTLNFASRAACIKNDVVVNEAKVRPKDLKAELEDWRRRHGGGGAAPCAAAGAAVPTGVEPERVREEEGDGARRPRPLKAILDPYLGTGVAGTGVNAPRPGLKRPSSGHEENVAPPPGRPVAPRRHGSAVAAAAAYHPLSVAAVEQHINDQVERKLAEKMQELQQQFLRPPAPRPVAPCPTVMQAPALLPGMATTTNTLESALTQAKAAILHVLNQGTLRQVMDLHLIGRKRGESLLAWRAEHGPFQAWEDLRGAGLSDKQLHAILKANVELHVNTMT